MLHATPYCPGNKAGNNAWLRRRLHAAIVRKYLEATTADECTAIVRKYLEATSADE